MDHTEEFVQLEMHKIGRKFSELRTIRDKHVETMQRSLRRHGQLTPVVVAKLESGYEMVDGFKRLRAALGVPEMDSLRCRVSVVSARAAKIAMFCLNQAPSGLNDLESALIVQSLHREEKMMQVEIAHALGRHKTWVCRRIQLAQRLSRRAQEDVRGGLLTPTAARALVKLPRGNQGELLDAVIPQGLSSREIARVVTLYQKAGSDARKKEILSNPRGALKTRERSKGAWKESLSAEGYQALKDIQRLEQLGNVVAGYLETEYPKAMEDQAILKPWLGRLDRTVKLLESRLQELA